MNYKIKGLEVEITDEQLDELIKERENKGKLWKPEKHEQYYFLDTVNHECSDVWFNHISDLFRFNSDNCFKTVAEAKEKGEYNDAVIAVNMKIRELNDGWTPDWSDGQEIKCSIFYNNNNQKWTYNLNYYINVYSYFDSIKSEELAEQVIKECAKELEIIKNYNLK